MDTFGTIDKIMKADEEELAKVEGIGKELARKIKEKLQVNAQDKISPRGL